MIEKKILGKREIDSLISKDSWRIFRIVSEFVDGFEAMLSLGPAVSIFGSARLGSDTPEYRLCAEISRKIAEKGFAVMTGGGPGLMEAGNYGASQAGGVSVGVSVRLPFEKGANKYVDPKYNLAFRYFFIRKVMFVRYAKAFVVLPGGIGTLDELFEALTLIQTEKSDPIPIILVGTEYWSGLIEWLREVVLKKGCIGHDDLNRITLCDDPNEIADIILQHYQQFHEVEALI
jgi:uncharacterized protein (TIGR00730 family)